MGSKSEAKILMRKNKVPTIPGYEGQNQDTALNFEAKKVGFLTTKSNSWWWW